MLTMLYLIFMLSSVSSFNIDTQSAYILKNTDNLFGYSVALHKATSENFLMIGAPTAQTSQPGVVKGGAVYKCKLDKIIGDPTKVKVCDDQLNILDKSGNIYQDRNGDINTTESSRYDILTENKTGQWLGVSVISSNEFVVGCAHRYESRYLQLDLYDDPPRQLVGKCWATNGDFDMHNWMDYKPCIDRDSGYDNYGYCQFGTSAAISGKDLIVGAPGRSQGVGGAFHYVMEDPLLDSKSEMLPIAINETADIFDKYIGYSSTICDLDADGIQDFIFGGPRGNMYKGEVYIYNLNDDNKLEQIDGLDATLEGSQMGSYYGHSLACADFNNDGYADLVIGAPWYTSYEHGKIPADTGRVYIYSGSWNYLPDPFEPIIIDGHQANAAFGFSLSTAGDINADGFHDLFIGAPYYNEGEGIIYLYLGSWYGVLKEPSQRITPSKLNILDNIKGFGWSISAGKDMDGNGYPDVLVGAQKSNHAVFLRTMKIVDVQPGLIFSSDEINPDEGTVEKPGTGEKAPGITLQVCFKYIGAAITSDSLVKVNYEVNLDISKSFSRSRIYFNYSNPTRTLKSTLNIDLKDVSNHCTSRYSIFYQEKNLDVRPIKVDIKADLAEAATFNERAVLNQQLIRSTTKLLIISSKCPKETGKCLVDMSVGIGDVLYEQRALYEYVVLGYVPKVTLPITVFNKGPHHSYGTVLNVTLPPYMSFSGIKEVPGHAVEIGRCETLSPHDIVYVMCRMPDPMVPDSKQVFGLEFILVNLTAPTDLVVVAEAIVKEPSYEESMADNSISYTISVKQLAELSIRGGSTQRRLPYNNQYSIIDKAIGTLGPDVRHDYEVVMDENALNIKVPNITVDIYWPHKFSNGAWLLPLINVIVPERLNDTVVCDWHNLEFLLDQSKDETLTDSKVIHSVSCTDRDPTRCLKLSCNIDFIQRGAAHLYGFKIGLIAKVHEASLYDFGNVNITSFAEIISVHKALVLPRLTKATATTELYPSVTKSRNYLWIIICGILAGLLLLLLIVLILWKCGFFKRKQPPSMKAEFVTS